MSRIGGATAPVKCEGNPRTLVEVKQEMPDHEENYEEANVKQRADSSVGKPSTSSLPIIETENSYEFMGNMKYEADESTDPLLSKKRDGIVCQLCQRVYCTMTKYGYHRKREFIAHLAKAHDYGHLRGHRRLTRCRGCKAKKERWTFVVIEGSSYKFSDMCNRCEGYTWRPTDPASDSHVLHYATTRTSISKLWKSFMAHQEMNAELLECPKAAAETPTAAGVPGVHAHEATELSTTEPLSSKKRVGGVCHLCQQVYYGHHRKRAFIARLVNVHNYGHLRGHRGLAQCRSCGVERERWSFVVGEGVNYKFSDECSICQANSHGRSSMTPQRRNFMAHLELNADHQESAEATVEAPTKAEDLV